SASVPCLPGTVRWPDAIVRHPVDAARYDLVFRLRFHWHMSLPRIVPFSTALATRRVGACLHFVYLNSYRHDFRRTHDLCSHTPGGQFRVHVTDLTRRCSEPLAVVMTSAHHAYEVRPRKDHRGVNLI